MYKAVNWRGTTAQKVLRVSVREIRDMQAAGIQITPKFLRSYQLHRNILPEASLQMIERLGDLVDIADRPTETLMNLGITYPQIVRYVAKQLGSNGHSKWYSSPMNVVYDWCDYLNDCRTLEHDMTSDRIKFPKNLHKAHQDTMKKIQIKKDERVNQMIRERLKLLNRKYKFESGEYFVRPAANTEELIREGEKLSHCVGRYAERYAKGECDILFVRRINEPDIPFYTMEIKGSVITQCRGFKNCDMTPEVRTFVDAFRAERLEVQNRIKIEVIQEVAV
jgi:hypothetical protein